MSTDLIQINDLALILPLRTSPLRPESRLERVYLTLALELDTKECADTDDIKETIDYASLANFITQTFRIREEVEDAYTLGKLAYAIHKVVLEECASKPLTKLHLTLRRHKVHSNASESIDYVVQVNPIAANEGIAINRVKHCLDGFEWSVIVGVNPVERKYKQPVRFTISVQQPGSEIIEDVDFYGLINLLNDQLSQTDYFTLEALATRTAQKVLRFLLPSTPQPNTEESPTMVTIQASKPLALPSASYPQVTVIRTFKDFPNLLDMYKNGSTRNGRIVDMNPLEAPHPPPHPLLLNPELITDIKTHTVALAIGSNLGDSCRNIELALRLLENPSLFPNFNSNSNSNNTPNPNSASPSPHLTITNTSFMYQSPPMYITSQPPFFNTTCLVSTNILPLPLLKFLKFVESAVGRVPSVRNGPRAVDVDIILYDDCVLDSRPLDQREKLDNLEGQLVVPHPRMCEREFVLRPLFDMIPDFIHPLRKEPIRTLLAKLPRTDPPMKRVIPFPKYPLTPSTSPSSSLPLPNVPQTLTYWTYPIPIPIPTYSHPTSPPHKTHIMSILNTTPDSFSDGSDHSTLPAALSYIRSSVSANASIIDIGGYSTRPNAEFVGVEEEIGRVVPFVEAIRQQNNTDSTNANTDMNTKIQNIPISIDTFRPEVAKAAILAGANCINDVYAFTGMDSNSISNSNSNSNSKSYPYTKPNECMIEMKKLAREMSVPVVLMHSRGDAGGNKDYSEYAYVCDDDDGRGGGRGRGSVLEAIKLELGKKVNDIVLGKGGLRRWYIIVDPGIGFSKTVEGNLEVLRGAGCITGDLHVGPKGMKRSNPLFGYPFLIGASRKSFLGTILSWGDTQTGSGSGSGIEGDDESKTKKGTGKGIAPKDRGWATAAAVACAVQQGALVVRVHDTKEMGDVVKVANAIWG